MDVHLSESGPLTTVVMKHARDAFGDAAAIDAQWRALGYSARPDLARAIDEHDRLIDMIRSAGADVVLLPPDDRTGLDSIYARDASVASARGMVLCRMGKALRSDEPQAQEKALRAGGFAIAGAIHEPGRLEGGDVVWLSSRVVAVGHGYRTNAEGIRQYREILGDTIDELIVVPLPHWRGPADVMHLMSFISPVDRDLAVVYSPLMPVPFRERLLDLGYSLVEVADTEFDSMAANVLALAPRTCVMLAGNPRTRSTLERAGARVLEYAGDEISVKGAGGPTCLTRPVVRTS